MFCMIKKKNYILPMFQNIVEIVKNNSFNSFKQRRMILSCNKKTISISKRNNEKHYGDFFCLNCLHSFATEKKT